MIEEQLPAEQQDSMPLPPPDPENALRQHITQQILTHPDRRIPFSDFMETVLYHPEHGYYNTQPAIGSRRGDFVTSPNLCADFGELLAEQFREMWERLHRPDPYHLVEMGAGQGRLADDILQYLQQHDPGCFAAVQYWIVERSPQLIATQRRLLQPFVTQHKVAWHTWDTIPSDSIVGCLFSNELVDAFPVHQVMRYDGELWEVFLSTDAQADDPTRAWYEVRDRLSTEQIQTYFAHVDIDLTSDRYLEGYRTEVNLAALDWMATVSDRLQQGYVLTIDYGYPAQRYYNPSRTHGTLQCYYQHTHHSNPYINLGCQDITTHVDFTALERQGERCGLHTLGFTQQGLFLMALGLGDRLTALSSPNANLDVQTLLLRREALHGLMDPMGVGNFGVLIQGKGVSVDPPLKGLSIPSLW